MKLSIGIVGFGRRGKLHANAVAQTMRAKVVAVADANLDALQRAHTDYPGIATFSNAATMADDPRVDALVVAAPAQLNGILASQVIRSGKPVLLEKPPAMSARQLNELAAAADWSGSRVMVAFNRRFNKLVRDAIAAVSARGRVIQIVAEFHKDIHDFTDDPRFAPEILDYMLLESPIHAVDLALHIADAPVVNVDSIVRRAAGPYRDVHAALVEFENGAVCQFTAAYTAGGRLERYEIHGEYVSAYLEGVNSGWVHQGNQRSELLANAGRFGDLIAQDCEFVDGILDDRNWVPHAATLESSYSVLSLCERILDRMC